MSAPSEAFDELGPALPSRVSVHVLAGQLIQEAQLMREFSGTGKTADLRRALACRDRMRALLGPSTSSGRAGESDG